MIDKILYVNDNKAVLYYTNKPPLTMHDDTGHVLELVSWLFECPVVTTYEEYKQRRTSEAEDTCLILKAA